MSHHDQQSEPSYPGLGLPLTYCPDPSSEPYHPMGVSPYVDGATSVMLQVREVSMMVIMETLTDKPQWHTKIFDDAIVAKWRDEALSIPDVALWDKIVNLSVNAYRYTDETDADYAEWKEDHSPDPIRGIMCEEAFEYIVQELRNKARYYEKTGLVPTLDATAAVVKADSIVPVDLTQALLEAFETLRADQGSTPDWHPGSNDMVQDLVHPSMYPLIYGISRVLRQERVGIADAIDSWSGKGDVIPSPDLDGALATNMIVSSENWSSNFQWLPTNVAFQSDGTPKLTSYVNNLHPIKHAEVYGALERLIAIALPAWDQCLKTYQEGNLHGPGRLDSRFDSQYIDDEDDQIWDPPNRTAFADVEVNWDDAEDNYDHIEDEAERKWYHLRQPNLPMPLPFQEIDYEPKVTLQEMFKNSGLQVIVKMASIELTPEKPEFPLGSWHVEGQMNEHICATAIYYLDSENITDASLEFRMHTSDEHDEVGYSGQDKYKWLERVYGTLLGGISPCIQKYGSVITRKGRVLAFPNVFQHRVSPFRLVDPSRPGYRRFIVLWLVSPYERVISTANVPPQQLSWWADSVFGSALPEHKAAVHRAVSHLPDDLKQLLAENGLKTVDNKSILEALEKRYHADSGSVVRRLPEELMGMIREELRDSLLLGPAEAREWRDDLMKERTSYQRETRKAWSEIQYNFCEH
ncbi:hypothetical protein GQ53DRAFT_746540 [Thozetella sp. PMI_491]|nr:hypothetical protein GQ53DRAFT_746540 [Thozetella sp. PMI_491]